MGRLRRLPSARLYSDPLHLTRTDPAMPRDVIILECTEAREEGKTASWYVTSRNKKSLRTPGRLEKIKFNPYLKRRTLHREKR